MSKVDDTEASLVLFASEGSSELAPLLLLKIALMSAASLSPGVQVYESYMFSSENFAASFVFGYRLISS